MAAEPLRNDNLYNPDEEDQIRPDLHVVKSGAKKSPKPRKPKVSPESDTDTGGESQDSESALKKAEESWGTAGVVKDNQDEEEDEEDPQSAVKKAEESWGTAGVVGGAAAESDQVGEGFNPDAKPSGFSRFKANLTRNKKKGLLGGGIFGGTGAIVIALFLALVPLKIEHIINNLRDHFLSTADSSLDIENLNIFKQYMTKFVGQGLKGCNTTISADCHVIVTGHGPIYDLYRTWANVHFERTLATEKHIVFTYVKDSTGGKYYIQTPDIKATQIGEDGKINDAEWLGREVSAPQLRSEVKAAYADETLWQRVVIRWKLNTFLHEKFGIPKCLVFCKVIDPLHDLSNQLKLTAKYFLASKVLLPLSEADGLAAMCFLDPGCSSATDFTDNSGVDAVGDDVSELNGAPVSKATAQIIQSLGALVTSEAADITPQGIADLVAQMEENGLPAAIIGSLVTKLLTALGVDSAGQIGTAATEAVPIIGWIELAYQIENESNNIGKDLKILSYIALSTAAASTFYTLATEASEMKAGHETSDEVGSFINALGSGNQVQGSGNNQVGGTASAEGTPLYSELIDGQTNVQNSSFSNYLCEPVSPIPLTPPPAPTTVPQGKSVCPIEVFGIGNTYFNLLHDFWTIGCTGTIPGTTIPFSLIPNSPCMIAGLDQVWGDTVGKVYNVINGAVGFIFSNIIKIENAIPCGGNVFTDVVNVLGYLVPGHAIFCAGKAVAKAAGPTILGFIEKYMLPTPFAADMSGGRLFDMSAAGADVTGNEYAHNGLGGMALSPNQVAQIQTNENKEELAEFQDEPIMSRLFDTSSQFSLVSKLAMDAPLNSFGVTLSSSLGSLFSNPFKGLVNGVASLLSPPKAYAATLANDPFGVQQYGYPDDNSTNAISSDPTGYWDKNCADGTQTTNWNNTAEGDLNPDTGVATNNTTNQCLLIQAAVGGLGAVYNQNLLTPDELNYTGANNTTSQSTNNEIYQVGDSLSVGMQSPGNITTDYASNGWTVSKIEATVGDTVADAIPKVQADASDVQASGTVVVELGTNNIYGTEAQFEAQIQNMISTIRAINPSAQIDWVDTYSSLLPNYQAINDAIVNESTTLNFKVIDWAGQVLANPTAYSFDTALGVHPQGSGYQLMASFVANSVGAAPSPTAMETTDNIVAEALKGTQNNQSIFSSIGQDIAKVFKAIGTTFRHDAVIFYRGKYW